VSPPDGLPDLFFDREDQKVSGSLTAVDQSAEIPCGAWDFEAHRLWVPCSSFHHFAD